MGLVLGALPILLCIVILCFLIFRVKLFSGAHEHSKKASTRQRVEAIDDADGVWQSTVDYGRYLKSHLHLKLGAFKDSDAVCIFWMGHTGWNSNSHCVGKKGQAVKACGLEGLKTAAWMACWLQDGLGRARLSPRWPKLATR